MKPRHATALALVGWYLIAPVSSGATSAKSNLAYTNKAYGVSFKYPSDWSLKEGGGAQLNWGYLGDVETRLPHGVTVVAVVMPEDSYPGSDLQLAFVSVSVDSNLSATQCNQSPRESPDQYHEGETLRRVGPLHFTEFDDGEAGMGRSWYVKYYHVYRNHACYEFQQGEGNGGYGAVTGITHRANDHEVFRRLNAILASVVIHPTTIASPQPGQKLEQPMSAVPAHSAN